MTIQSNLYPTTTPRTQHFAGDSGKCDRCNTTISRNEIQTDWLGRTVVVCPSCGPMLLVLRRGAPLVRAKYWHSPTVPRVHGKCKGCKAPLIWKGMGGKPVWCKPCKTANNKIIWRRNNLKQRGRAA